VPEVPGNPPRVRKRGIAPAKSVGSFAREPGGIAGAADVARRGEAFEEFHPPGGGPSVAAANRRDGMVFELLHDPRLP
jgi:hypothetical protein